MLEIAEFIPPSPAPLWKLVKQAGFDLAVGGLPFDMLQPGERVCDYAPLKRMKDRYEEGGFAQGYRGTSPAR
jgi:mannonate dehydratase